MLCTDFICVRVCTLTMLTDTLSLLTILRACDAVNRPSGGGLPAFAAVGLLLRCSRRAVFEPCPPIEDVRFSLIAEEIRRACSLSSCQVLLELASSLPDDVPLLAESSWMVSEETLCV